MFDCLKCENPITELVNWNTLCEDFIECPHCGTKLVVNYDEVYHEDTYEVDDQWWLEYFEPDKTKPTPQP